jgi:RHS repeat-associated protein
MNPDLTRSYPSRETIMQRIIRIAGLLACAVATNVLGCSGGSDSSSAPAGAPADATEQTAHDPTVRREPKESKSLTLSSDWQPPAPTRTRPAQLKARVVPSKQYGVPTPTLGPRPSDAEFGAVTVFPEPLRPVPGASSDVETEALALAFRAESDDDRGIDALERFTEAYPQSRWTPGIHLNLGTISYSTGYFQDALSHWKSAWELAKQGEDGTSQQIANQALAEYARMNARLGRTTELQELLKEAEGRTFMGDARVKIEGAVEGLWTMQHRPGVAFLCGPYAVSNVAQALRPDWAKKATAFVDKIQSPVTGFSVSEVHRMSAELGLELQIARREPGAVVIIPAVVHWKLGHFGALVRESDGRFRLQDPTFRNDVWLSQQALDREASGYFLVPAGALPSGWTRATAAEVSHIYGKGYTDNLNGGDTGPEDHQSGGGGPGPGPGPCVPEDGGGGAELQMATYRFHTLLASLHIEDTPVGYAAAVGPDVRVRVAYNQREANQPSTMDFTNFGPQFVSNWVSYLIDNPSSPSADIGLRKRGGGSEVHGSFNATTQAFGIERKTGSVLYRLTANTYKKVYPDGHQEFYEQYIGTSGTARKVFLTRIVDPQGNEVALEYDSTYPARIHQIVDATGLPTVFDYDHPSNPYLVTSIEDPFGREGTFTYTSAAGQPRLQSIEDPDGIISAFEYSAAGEIVKMTTPYGTTTFNLSAPSLIIGENLIRYVEATDALGQKERVEFIFSAMVTSEGASLEPPLPSASVVNFTNNYNQHRNSYFWDRLQMKLAPGNYQKAHRYHWVHSSPGTATSILESEVPPLEGRIFYNYPGQTNSISQGTLASPSVVARVVKDAQGNNQTQAKKYQYNAQGNVTWVTDPVGRETLYEYATNGVDVVAIKQRTGTSGSNPVWTTMTSYTYGGGAPPHRPSSVTDGAGKTTQYTYSTTTGQVLTITNAKSEVTTFTYETNSSSAAYGKVLSITGDVSGGNRTFTYDAYGRMATSTDSEGYTLTYDYDALDRVRTTTYPDGTHEQYEYDDHSLVATRDREGRWTRHSYNPLMERVATQDPELRTTQFQWCRCGKLRRFVDGNGNITEWQRDERSRLTKKINSDTSFETYTYDLSGRLQTEVDAMGRTTTYAYTVDDRIAKKDYSDTATPDVTYAYDTWYPRLTSQVDGTGTTTFAYHPDGTATNGAGQVALVNGPVSNDTLKHTYDELTRLKKLEIVDDATQTTASYSEEWTFDARSRVTGEQNNLGSTTYSFVGQSGRPTTVNYPNGMQTLYDYFGATGDFLLKQIKNLSAGPSPTVISQFDYTYRQDRAIDTWKVDQGSGATTWTFGYDGARQLASAIRRDATPTVLESLSYSYDKAGNRIQVGAGTAAPRNFEVNNLNQLLSERDHGRTTFAGFLDELGTVKVNGKPAKVTSTGGAAPFKFEALVDLAVGANTVVVEARDGNNNVATKTYSVPTTGASKKYEYDANGNLRYEKQPNGTVIREYRWDQQNRLVRMLAGTHESVYEYDGQSRRVRITEKENSVQTNQETFIWCGARICQKRNGLTVVRSYFGQGFEQGSDDYFYVRDRDESVREVVASDGVTVGSRLSYDPWGKVTETGSVLSDFTYTGHYYDRPTGMSLAWYRGYDPSLGRWLSKDPIGLKGGLNLYGYVGNDPSNFLDPAGKCVLAIAPWILNALEFAIAATAGGTAAALCVACGLCGPDAPDEPADGPMCETSDNGGDKKEACYKKYLEQTAYCGEMWTDDRRYNLCMENAWKNYIRCLNGLPPKVPLVPWEPK